MLWRVFLRLDRKHGINIKGEYILNLRFADDIVNEIHAKPTAHITKPNQFFRTRAHRSLNKLRQNIINEHVIAGPIALNNKKKKTEKHFERQAQRRIQDLVNFVESFHRQYCKAQRQRFLTGASLKVSLKYRVRNKRMRQRTKVIVIAQRIS